jgi:hypothetical protein
VRLILNASISSAPFVFKKEDFCVYMCEEVVVWVYGIYEATLNTRA